ncbi:hypothetical protein Tco_0899596, partial [Tanacetum coccineum]
MGGPAIATGFDNSREGNGDKVSFASLLKKPMPSKAVRLSMIKNDESVTGANVAIPLPAMEEVSKRFENTLYGYFIGKRLAFPVVENYVKNAWEKFGLERTMLSNGYFIFQFSSRDGMERVLENGPWLIRLVPIILNIWTPNTRLKKETITSAPIWVKLHNVPIVAYSEIGLSLITSQIGNPIMLDAYTSVMCQKSWGRNSYARALVEVSSLNPLQDSLVVAIPFPDGSRHSLESIEVEYEWTPPRCETCKIFDHVDDACPIRVKVAVQSQVAGMKLTKPKLNLVYKVVNKQRTHEGTSSQPVEHQFKQPPKHAEKENLVSLSNSFETFNEFEDGPPIKKVYGSTIVDNLLSDDEEDIENVDDETINASTKNVSKGASTPSQEVFKRWNWTSNNLSCMKSSRIIMGWNPDILNVVVIASDDQVMHTCVLFKADKKEVVCSVVYAHNNYIHRRALWKNLNTIKGYVRGRPWVVLECVEDIEVVDVNSTGLKFTWNQNPKGDSGLLKKIDRIMSNLEFSANFVGSCAVFQPYRTSDHAPAVLRIPMNSMKRPHEEDAYLHAYQDAILMEERLLVQKAKIEWLKLGDANTAYFHKVVKSQIARNRIDSIVDNNGATIDGDQVPLAFIDHYTEFLGQPDTTTVFHYNDIFCNRLSMEGANSMIREVSDKEIKDTMFSMGDNKAPGPDGFSAAFFKEAWDIIGVDVCKAIKEFFTNDILLKELNHSIIALIPKVNSPVRINDYRPISCCNTLYKRISKILANRMKESLSKLISLNQSAFVSGRRISDNILLTQEFMHNYHLDRGPARCAFKVDIQKAYDTVDWLFLKDILTGFGFHHRMIGWIMECVMTTSFSLSINGCSHGFFKGLVSRIGLPIIDIVLCL